MKIQSPFVPVPALTAILAATFSWSCDSDISGSAYSNAPPETHISVRDESLVDNLGDENRLTSTVQVSWTGDDEDGFVSGFELRYYPPDDEPDAASGWVFTTRNDSLILLPIPAGSESANVLFEVRAIDNDGARDETPARTVFPIKNSPPEIRFSQFELPPDTTFPVVSFAWTATDPDGEANLKSIDIGLNDSLTFESLPPDVAFVTLLGEIEGAESDESVEARVYTGRGVESTSIRLPDLRLDDVNTFYLRVVDRADAASYWRAFEWNVKRVQSEVLYVNDYRIATAPTIQAFHLDMLNAFLPEDEAASIWDISTPYATGSAGDTRRSDLLPPNAEPSLRLTFSLFKYIYWVSTNTTNSVIQNNLPYAAAVMNDFFDAGGKMVVHSPVSVPATDDDFNDNAAVLLLPLSAPIALPDSVRRFELRTNALVVPTPQGSAFALPDLVSRRFFINIAPFEAIGANILPLYEGEFHYRNDDGSTGVWPGARTLASISLDNRVALFAFPLVDDQTGNALFVGSDEDPDAVRHAVHAVLNQLGFPRR